MIELAGAFIVGAALLWSESKRRAAIFYFVFSVLVFMAAVLGVKFSCEPY